MEKTVLTVSQLNGYVKMLIDGNRFFSNLYIRGEISNFTNHYRTGHFYLTLKDEKSLVKAVMFQSSASRLKFMPENGMKVIVHGRLAVFERDGQYQLYLDDMQPDGLGALHVAFEQLKQKLQAEGLFDPAHKLPLPKRPMRVGVITSPTGAAVRDIINVTGRRFPLAEIRLYPVLVQGDGAPAQLCRALDYFESTRGADVLIIGRGGGSLEELWAFNSEELARKIYAMTIPVISAVGHETDFTIADFVADLRAPTPSAAAELCVPSTAELKQQLDNLLNRFAGLELQGLERRESHLRHLKERLDRLSPDRVLDDRRMNCEYLLRRIEGEMKLRLSAAERRFAEAGAVLEALSPLKTLARGYSIVQGERGVVNELSKLREGETVCLWFQDGQAEAQVTKLLPQGND